LAALFGWMLSVSPTETLRVKPLAILLGVLAVLPLLGLLAACPGDPCARCGA
jgi:hypothetical protein